jgi:hypothetical protein
MAARLKSPLVETIAKITPAAYPELLAAVDAGATQRELALRYDCGRRWWPDTPPAPSRLCGVRALRKLRTPDNVRAHEFAGLKPPSSRT